VRAVNGIRVIFDESRASVTSPVPYTKLFSAISADLRCAEPWRPGIKMRFIEEGMSALGHSRPSHFVPVLNNVRYASDSDHSRYESELTLWANSDIPRRNKRKP
jgi:hypothetical protein